MKAVTDFAATREQIAFAKETFASGFALCCEQENRNRQTWIDRKVNEDWFRRSVKYWTERSTGDSRDDDIFDNYRMKRAFQAEGQGWFEARLEDATQLLQKFDCAVDTCEAVDVILSDKDLTLLSVSLESALRN